MDHLIGQWAYELLMILKGRYLAKLHTGGMLDVLPINGITMVKEGD